MVAVFNKELLSWYLITLKLKETVEAGIQNSQSEYSDLNNDQLHKQQQNRTQSLQRQISYEVEKVPNTPEPEWVINIRERLEQARADDMAGDWAKLCIYRVPQCLREGDDKAYLPQTLSIGPYHHGKKRIRNMDRHKWRALEHVLKRTHQDVTLYLNAVQELEEKARSCYEGQIGLSSNEFVEMMVQQAQVLDGCFVLELFRGAIEGFKQLGYSRNDPVFAMRGSMHAIQRDMIMIENQLPLFILDLLIGIQLGQPEQRGIVAKLAIQFFDPLMPTDEPLSKSDRNIYESSLGHTRTFDPFSDQGGLHCLDVFRRSLLQKGLKPEPRVWIKKWSSNNRVADKRRQQLIHCVTELRAAGIKFKRRKTDRFWDIKFKDGILRIPRLLIHDGTKSLFLNLIAFEQCHLDSGNDVTSYMIFMDNLINSSADVAYLHYHGIIEHWLGSDDEVADLFNKLCEEVVFDINDSYLSPLSEQVNRYYDYTWNTWRASLKHTYFSNPWSIISFIAAVILLVLTFVQSYYGIYGYYYPRS